jgi:hypothetical protein
MRRYLIGADGRFSTSRAQVALWTLALFFALTFFSVGIPMTGSCPTVGDDTFEGVAAKECPDFGTTFDQLDASYLLLLGGPFAAAVASGAVVADKVNKRQLQKVKASKAQLKDLFTDDSGDADLVDLQFFIFNIVGLVFFAAALLDQPVALPSIPEGIIGLTSLAALAYTGAKAVAANEPVIDSITRARRRGAISPGSLVQINGSNFVPPGGDGRVQRSRVRVRFGEIEEPVVPRSEGDTPVNPTDTKLQVRVPMRVPVGDDVKVVVVTAAGVTSRPYLLKVIDDD